MTELELRELFRAARQGHRSRRAIMRQLTGLGFSAPFVTMLLSRAGVAQPLPAADYRRTQPGGGGPLKMLFWQAPTLLNPHFATGLKDQEASRIFYEPLAAWDQDGNLSPVLAAEIPDLANGGLAADGMSVTWPLKNGVRWHDGRAFTADDVVFNWEYAADPETATTTIGSYKDIAVDKIDPQTVRVRFSKPTPFWADPFVSQIGMIIPKHLFEAYKGAASRDAPTNLKPVGTGPYRYVDFRPGDLVKGERNPDYHMPNRPYFDTIELKGGGDAVSAARAVIQTGEYDYAWNLQVEDEILRTLEAGGAAKGRVEIVPGGTVEHIQFNFSDPWTEIDGQRSRPKSQHPLLSDPAVRKALSLLVDRTAIEKYIYGRTGIATGNFINNPKRFVSNTSHWEFSVENANHLLDQAGWKVGSDGIRARDGKQLKFVFQTSINAPRQKTQAIIKQACKKAGVEIELRSIPASVYFSSDVGNPDTYRKFYSDIQMFAMTMGSPDPTTFMRHFLSSEVASKHNKWQGRNITRWRDKEFDELFRAAERELDPARRAALFIKMNDLVVGTPVVIPVVYRPGVSGISRQLRARLSDWDSVLWDLPNWYRET